MAIACASSGPRLLSWSIAPLRRVYSTSPTNSPKKADSSSTPRNTNPKASAKKQAAHDQPSENIIQQRWKELAVKDRNTVISAKKKAAPPKIRLSRFYIPEPARNHVFPKGQLRTTPEVWSLLHETRIHYNNSKAEHLDLGEDHDRILRNFGCEVKYSPLHIVHPYHLQCLRPQGHPMMPTLISKYRRKVVEEPMWIFSMHRGPTSGVARSMPLARLTKAIWEALKVQGYPDNGIRGTVLLYTLTPTRSLRFPAHVLGEAVATAVQKEWKKHLDYRLGERDVKKIIKSTKTIKPSW
ncbi:hypothetical protein NM208_g13005 [Fusarium decemcellulare]|uniref:Uncharacterized protein n=1 Tax=Fusarium decemcellulare TaxID=57161 RepID=A0ACC1RQ15_9HYPO|nr:hypothetical protein NM208_g13005 [Fusarium decemcellulare]